MKEFLLELANLMDKHNISSIEAETITYEVWFGTYETQINMVVNGQNTYVQKDDTRFLEAKDLRELSEGEQE